MNEPKRRPGRPSNAEIAARQAPAELIALPVVETAVRVERAPTAEELHSRAQAYALRVWNGQADYLKRAERIERIERALKGQNLPTDSIRLPGSDHDDDWSEEDSEPVTWRVKLPPPEGIV